MVQCAKSVAINIDDQGAVDTWRRQNGLVSTINHLIPRLLLLRDIDQLGGSAASVECSGRQLLILTNIPMSREHLAHAAFYSHFQLSPGHRQNMIFYNLVVISG